MNKQYSTEFKLEDVKRIERTGELVIKVAEELSEKHSTMQGWGSKYKQSTIVLFIDSRELSLEDEKFIKA